MKPLVSSALGALLAAAALTVASAQDPQQPQQPASTFRSSVDLVPVDINIIDRGGNPVKGLQSGDFSLTIDGKPRRIASAQFVSTIAGLQPVPDAPSHYTSNLSANSGRLIMLVIDQANIGAGRGKLVLDAASRFISRLNPADRVGLVAIPGAGPQIDFTANHAVVQSMLPKLVGQAQIFMTQRRVGISEAYRLQRGDRIAMNEMLERECPGATAQDLELCRRGMLAEAQSMYATARERTRNSLVALRYLVERLSATPAPKTVVFISEGLIVERELEEVSWLGPLAARGQIVLYVLQLDEPMFDASNSRMSPTRTEDIELAADGLSRLAGLGRGTVFKLIANPDSAFSRLGLELSGYYLLSFEPEPGDRDGNVHKIKVDVPGRQGLEIRARTEFSVDAAASRTEEAVLADTLKAPLLASDIGIKLSAYTLRDPAADKLRILVAAEIDRSLNPDGKIVVAYTLTDDKGRLVASQVDRDVKTPVRPATKTQTYTGSIESDSTGVHTLKLAVIDDRGRRGSVEHTFRAALTSIGQLRATDFLIAENQGSTSGGVTPSVGEAFTTGMLHGYIELYSESADVLKNTTVMFQVAQTDQSSALDGVVARMQPAPDTPNRRAAEGAVRIALLTPGDYVARAVISIDGRRAGQVTRPFRVGRVAATTSTAPGTKPPTAGAKAAPIPFTSRIEKFDRGSVLTPQVLGFFLDRMNFGARGEPNAGPAIEHARAGRFDEALKTLNSTTVSVPSVFLTGLSLYSKGQLDPAANKFRETLRLDSEFLPAAFYLGSCFAAGGRDDQAVGAWQLSLITESEAPFIYTLLGDALIRLNQNDRALQILTEASSEWPDDEQVRLRLGTAQAAAGKRTEALQTLEPYLAAHPDDHDRLLIALRTLYQARAEGKSIRSPEEDRALFTKWAAAYSAAKGPQQAMVDQWQKAMNKK